MYIEVAAHRGNVAEYPENTMPAYISSYEIGADKLQRACVHDIGAKKAGLRVKE